jgi:phosphoglycerol transferase MdoB-like AlkP superfamily enzyme
MFLLFRVFFLFTYCNFEEIFQSYKHDLLLAFWNGFRCDTVVLCFALMPLFALNLSGFLLYLKPTLMAGFNHLLHIISKVYYIILFIGIYWIGVVDFFYYRNFQTHFDDRVFGIVEDGTKAVMASVWSDYPVFALIFIFIIAFVIWIIIINKLQAGEKPLFRFNNLFAHIATVILSTGILFIGARSSFSMFPFRKNDLAFSANLRINDAAANGVFMLKEAINERMSQRLHLNCNDLLLSHGFSTFVEAKREWSLGSFTDSAVLFDFIKTADNPFLENNPPNIVLIIMEGWSSDLFNYHSKTFNLLGAFEEQLPHLIYYPYCFPVNFGTISALETFFTHNVGPALSLSEYAHISLSSSTASVFQKKGYETSYYTSGYNGWRNVGKYCRTQGFDNVRGAEYIKSLYPKTEETDWGVFDQYLFDALFQKLQEHTLQPQFVIGMTITNHSPHKIPKNYELYPLDFPDSILSRTTAGFKQTLSSMETFQYANHCLGRFIDSLRHLPLGNNTIVAITGDHALTSGLTYHGSEFVNQWAVPLLFYIPEPYRKQLSINTNRLVSHKDILPTIFNLAFSNYNYQQTGDNIFDDTTEDNAFVVTHLSWVLGKNGCVNLSTHQSYLWQENSYLLQLHPLTPELEKMRNRANAWLFGMKWQVWEEIKNKKTD